MLNAIAAASWHRRDTLAAADEQQLNKRQRDECADDRSPRCCQCSRPSNEQAADEGGACNTEVERRDVEARGRANRIMAIWLPSLQDKSGTRAQVLVDALRVDITAGLLRPRDRLPPQRELAYRLGLSPHTVMRAYSKAIRRGYVRGEVGRGTYVCSPEPRTQEVENVALARPETGPIDFSRNLPFPGESGQALAATLADLVRAGGLADCLDHERGDVTSRHRQAGATWIGRHGLSVEAERVVLTCGTQQGSFATLAVVLRPGDVLLTEALAYAPLKAMARHLGVRIIGFAMDNEGILPEAFEAACRQHTAPALYLTPTLQTPNATTMGEARRQAIARIAEIRDLVLVEDDVFGLLLAARPLAVAAFAPNRTVFITGLSKVVAPGLRVGFVHTPEHLTGAVEAAVAMPAWMPPPLIGEIATRWIGYGTAQTLMEDQRRHAARRHAMAHEELASVGCKTDPYGSHLRLPLPAQWEARPPRPPPNMRACW